jgi:hypothetical protein
MCGYLPHIIICSLVDLDSTLFYPGGILYCTQRAREHCTRNVANERLAYSRDEFELLLGVVTIVRLV